MHVTDELLKKIASELELGLRVFVHRETFEVIAVPTEEDLELGDPELWETDLDRIGAVPGAFVLFEPMDSSEAFSVMEAYAGTVADPGFSTQLKAALLQPKPFARFYEVINRAGAYRERWFAFKQEAVNQWLRQKWARLFE
ncbi:hypothetical protein [Flaviaesturariibacter amylovorans]|uniref:Uncharacterized protein n=1 Tax=Flaviaesturariibacter amylovorans TaxID=1084520 RepID=A0ABP8G3Z9_9BACT